MARKAKARSGSLFSPEESLLVATNRANLLAMCATGVIWPADAYRKHYRDLSDLTPGAVPVFAGRIHDKALSAAGREANLFDVALELDPLRVKLSRSVAIGGTTQLSISEGPIPWAAVRVVYVRTAEDAADLASRQFDDVPAGAWSCEVKPEVWSEADASSAEDWRQALADSAGKTQGADGALDVDRFLGALCMMRKLAPSTMASDIGFAALCSRDVRKTKLPKSLPSAPDWVSRLARALRPEPDLSSRDVDQRLLDAALVGIRDVDAHSGFDPAQLVEAITQHATRNAEPNQAEEIRLWSSYALKLANGEMAPPQLDDSGSEVKRSLLLFVLRPDPVRLVKAGQSSFRPGPVVHALAGTLSGYAATYSRLERDLKGDAQRHAAMSLVALNRLAVVQQSGSDHEAEISLTSTDDEPLGVARAVTRIGGLVLSDRKLEPTDEMKKLYFQAKSARFALRFDPVWNRFLADVEIGEDNTRQVFIEAGRPSRHNQPSVQFSTNCELAGGRSAKALGKSELLSLLERNADLDMQCRFGISRTDGRLQLVAHQLIETLDIQELRAHLDSVARTAHEVTVSIAGTAKGAAAVESD